MSSFATDKKYTVKEAAVLVGVSGRTIERLIEEKKLQSHKIGRRIIITESQINALGRKTIVKYDLMTDWTNLSDDELDELDPAAGTGKKLNNP